MIGGRYKLRADMGQGTFGRVVECWDMEQWRRVAVKIVRKARALVKYYSSSVFTHRACLAFPTLAFTLVEWWREVACLSFLSLYFLRDMFISSWFT